MKKQVYLILLVVLASMSCSKTNPFTIDTSGITVTDGLGNISGSMDPSDWGFDGKWSDTEQSLFLNDPIDLSESKESTISMSPVYPNPVPNRVATFSFTSSDTTFVKIVIVDDQLKKLSFFTLKTSPGLNAYSIPFPEAVYPGNKNYRLYYSFDTFSKPGYFKGHGDISIK